MRAGLMSKSLAKRFWLSALGFMNSSSRISPGGIGANFNFDLGICSNSLVIIDDFDVFRCAALPHETDAPLVVDSDRMLTLAVTLQRLQPITPNGGEVGQ